MTKDLRDISILIFGVLGMLWYYVCLVVIGMKVIDGDSDATNFREFMSISLTTIGIALATFVGMLLGLRGVADDVRREAEAEEGEPLAPRLTTFTTSAAGSALQWCAALLYVVSLVIALIFWYRGGNTTDPAIVNLGKSLLGLIGGALSVVLNLPR